MPFSLALQRRPCFVGQLQNRWRLQHKLDVKLLLLAGCFLGAWDTIAATAGHSPRTLIMGANQHLITALKVSGDVVHTDPRFAYALAQQTVLPLIDFERVGRQVMGKYWRSSSAVQRVEFVREFRDYATNRLVSAIVKYRSEIVAYSDGVSYPPLRTTPDRGRATVRMRVRLHSGMYVEVDYRTHCVDNNWLVYDVLVEGLSLVHFQRQRFDEEIKQHGLDVVIDRLSARNREQGRRLGSIN